MSKEKEESLIHMTQIKIHGPSSPIKNLKNKNKK